MDFKKIRTAHRTVKKGFSLLEILLVFSSLALLGGLFLPLYQGSSARNQINQTQQEIISYLYQTRLMALSGYQNQDWGIHLSEQKAILFPGNDFEKRNPSQDLVYPLSSSVSFSPQVFIFSSQTGLPQTFGRISLRKNNLISQISVLSQGLIQGE